MSVLDLIKRAADAGKAALGRVQGHLGLAKAAHDQGMDCISKAAAHMVGAAKVNKSADPDTLAGHIAAAHKCFGKAAGHLEDMDAHLGKAMTSWDNGELGGRTNSPGVSTLTEGSVPQYEGDREYGKSAQPAPPAPPKAPEGYLSPDQVQEMINKAVTTVKSETQLEVAQTQIKALQSQVEMLSKMPAGAPRVKIFDINKTPLPGFEGDGSEDGSARVAKMVEGVDFNMQNESDFTKAGSTMIANMIKNGPKFGKSTFGRAPMWDQAFHGRGGTGARN